MSNPAKEILVIGLGLIGSSLAKAAKNKGLIIHGFDEDKNSLEEALNKNIIDRSFESLKDINAKLWVIEDDKRQCDCSNGFYGGTFLHTLSTDRF